jgi:hypothetical protein
MIQGDPIPVGNNWKNSVVKNVASGSSSLVSINFGNSASWVPACVSLKVTSIDTTDGSDYGFTEVRYWIRHRLTSDPVIIHTSTVVAGSNLTLTTLLSSQTIEITAANGSGTTNLQFMWDIDIDSVNVPVVV